MRPVLVLAGWVMVIALALSPMAWNRVGTAGLAGLAAAAMLCFVTGAVAELLAAGLQRVVQPLGLMLIGMTVRMAPPLALCVVLAAQRISGREHLAFIAYLLTFYMVTLALETWSAVHRIASTSSRLKQDGAN